MMKCINPSNTLVYIYTHSTTNQFSSIKGTFSNISFNKVYLCFICESVSKQYYVYFQTCLSSKADSRFPLESRSNQGFIGQTVQNINTVFTTPLFQLRWREVYGMTLKSHILKYIYSERKERGRERERERERDLIDLI